MNVRVSQLLSFTAGMWHNGTVEMNQYIIKLWMITQTSDPVEQNIAFRRMTHFIYNELDSTIFINSNEKNKCAELVQVGFNITTLPGDSVDQLIGIMLLHKLNAIMEGRISILEVEISTADELVYLHGEHEISEDLTQPVWWSTPDLVHADILDRIENTVSMQSVTNWRDLELAWSNACTDGDTENIIVFADLKFGDDTK